MGAVGSQAGLAFKEESVWGTNPTGQLTGVNFSSEDLAFAIENQVSNHIRPDRQTGDLVQVGAECSGGFESEFQAENLDDLIPGFFWDANNWNSAVAAGNVTFAEELTPGEGGLMTVVDSSLFSVGLMFGVTGTSSNEGLYTVKEIVDGTTIRVYAALVDEASVAVTFTGETVTNGVFKRSFTIERSNNDISQFFTYTGMVPNTMEMSIESGSPVTIALGFVGKEEVLAQVSPNTPAPTELSTNPVMNAVSSVGRIAIDGADLASCLLQKISVTIDNQVEGKTGIGVLGFCSADAKSLMVSGSISMYFNDETYYKKYLDSASFSIAFEFNDALGNTYAVRIPECKFDSATANVTGKDDDVMVEGTFVAIVDPNDGYTIAMLRSLV